MPIVPTVARRTLKVRLALLLIVFALVLGGATMIYPFMVMVTGSLSNRYDYGKFQALPTAMWREDEAVWKYLFERYAFDDFVRWAALYLPGREHQTWESLAADPKAAARYLAPDLKQLSHGSPSCSQELQDYDDFLRTLPADRFSILHPEETEEDFQDFLKQRYKRQVAQETHRRIGPLQALAREWGVSYEGFHQITLKREFDNIPKWYPPHNSASYRDFYDFKAGLEPRRRAPILASVLWQSYLGGVGSVETINREWGTHYATRYEIPFSPQQPPVPQARRVWEEFLREWYPRRLIQLDEATQAKFQPRFAEWLAAQFGAVEVLNKAAETRFGSFAEVPLAASVPVDNNVLRVQWMNFVTDVIPPDRRQYWSGENAWRQFLLSRYGSLEAIGAAHGRDVASLETLHPPCRLADLAEYEHVRWRHRFAAPLANYRRVLEFIAVKGRALRNTLILVGLSVLAALTVNPLAAYALSRYSLKASHKILLFLLATMAFPHEVTMIPNFLMLRDMGLLNTFAALILPGLANGFSIFLLKGFFDSLPRELYEAAAIDGASELRTFLTITLPLTKPILAVIALNAFVQAYASFMWAFVVCQKESMWTLMVWLYQFQQASAATPHLVMASICVACIPTLIVFLFCQRIILRGIVVPQMK